jgi:hypothetical protein
MTRFRLSRALRSGRARLAAPALVGALALAAVATPASAGATPATAGPRVIAAIGVAAMAERVAVNPSTGTV